MAIKLNGWIAKFLAGCLWAVVLTAITFMGTGIVANDEASRDRDAKIQEEAVIAERRTNTALNAIRETQNRKFTEILVAIEGLKNN